MLSAEAATKTPPLIAVLAPFIISIAFLALMSPLLTTLGKKKVRDQIVRDSNSAGQPIANDGTFPFEEKSAGNTTTKQIALPAAVDPKNIDDYVDYVVDLVGFVPTILLPIAGAIFALGSDITQSTAIWVLLISLIVAFFGFVWILTKPAQNYASRKVLRLSLASWAGIGGNLASLGLIAWAS